MSVNIFPLEVFNICVILSNINYLALYLFLLFGVPASFQSCKSIFQISDNLRWRPRSTEQRHLVRKMTKNKNPRI